ncbi:MAG: hypothetical protein O7D29_00005, partial [Gemmatimonadetes bacterium]|nr:hypothetical protein [Gemmatimonadota bacterium]
GAGGAVPAADGEADPAVVRWLPVLNVAALKQCAETCSRGEGVQRYWTPKDQPVDPSRKH